MGMTLEQTLETVAKIQKAWDALALSISDAAETFVKMWEEVFSSPDIWPGRKSVPPKKYGMSLLKKRPYQAFSAYQYRPIPPSKQTLPAAFLLRMRLDISNLR